MARVDTQLTAAEKRVLDYLKTHNGVLFTRDDMQLLQEFPDIRPKSLGWYLWRLHKRGLITRSRDGRRVSYGLVRFDQPFLSETEHGMVSASQKFTFSVLLERHEDGYVVVSCPALPGCHTQGKSREEAIANIREAIKGYIASMRRHGEAIPQEDVAQVEVEVAA